MAIDFRTHGMYISAGCQQETWSVAKKNDEIVIETAHGQIMQTVNTDRKYVGKAIRLLQAEVATTPYRSREWYQLVKDAENARYY